MPKHLIVTITGPDRIGFVESITKLLLTHDANIEESRMARLGGEFAMLMLVSLEDDVFPAARDAMVRLESEGYQVTTRETTAEGVRYAGWLPYRIWVNGADHEGIIHHISGYLAEQGINIETLNTGTVHAPMSGTPLFTMEALVLVPPTRSLGALRGELERVGDSVNVDTEVTPYTG